MTAEGRFRRTAALAHRIGLRRDLLRAAGVLASRHATALRRPRPLPIGGRILCYHSVGTPEWGPNDVSPNRFRRHLEVAIREGCRFVSAEQIAAGGGSAGDLALTFDDGLRSVILNAAPVLAEAGIPWTLFVVTGWASRGHPFLSWDEVAAVPSLGGTVASHSVTHPHFGRLDPAAARKELAGSREEIKARTGLVADSFAIPYGGPEHWSRCCTELARAVGYGFIYGGGPDAVPRTLVSRYDTDRVFRAALEGAFDR